MSKVYLADKDTLDSVNEKVGTGSDTESSAPTTLFAGIKHLISTLTNHVANWTAARAAKIDSIDTNTARITVTRAGYIDLLGNATNGLAAIKSAVTAAGPWFAKYGTNITLGSKTTVSVGTANVASGNGTKYLNLITADIPEDGMYQWSVNNIDSGYSKTANGTTNDYPDIPTYPCVELSLSGSIGPIDKNDSGNTKSQMKRFTIVTGTPQSANGYIYLRKGMRVVLRIEYNTNSWGDRYNWVSVASAYIKYTKQAS